MPYAIIAILGIVAVIIISVIGLNNRAEIADSGEEGTETEETAENGENGEAEEGETASDVDADSIYQANCAACHGADLSGGAGPTLAGTSLSEDELKEIITNGTDGGMPAFPDLQGEELDALASWLGEQ